MNFQRASIAGMAGYVPGEQLAGDGVVKLNTNENPYPPGPGVARALAGLDAGRLRRYPPAAADEFRRTAAAMHSAEMQAAEAHDAATPEGKPRTHTKEEITAANIIATNGGDELLRLAMTTFVDGGDEVVVMEPGYSLYPVLAGIYGAGLQRVALTADFGMPPDFVRLMQRSKAKLLMLANPHAPSGRLLDAETVARIVEAFKGVVVLDEAYVDFVDPAMAYQTPPLVLEFDNLLILRTLSKGYSLAGLRFGYGIGAASLIEPMLHKTRDSYNTGIIGQVLATAALQERDYARGTWEKVRQQRRELSAGLERLGFTVVPSQANFVLAAVPGAGKTAARLYQALKERDILVRYFDEPRLRDRLRISVGSEEENRRLLDALSDIIR